MAQSGHLIMSDSLANDYSSVSLCIQSNIIVIGSYYDDTIAGIDAGI